MALLGYTDASLLDEIVDAFAAGEGSAVFRVVNRVIEGGHEPRRFAADLLDRFRDLIVLAAVPDAAETGLLDLPQDRAERMAAQAGRFGQAGLARAAEIVSTGLDQMRGATSPRLLLELTCAQVLLPAAATDEKSLLARLERLEHSDRASPAPRPQAPASPPHCARDDEAERTGGTASAKRQAPDPPRQPAPERPAPERPAPERPAPERPAPGRIAPPAVPREAAAPAQAGPGESAADLLRKNWDAVLDAVKRERRVASILLSNASVVSLQDGILTLRFVGEGELKRFSTSDYDADLKRVLSAGFGLNVMVRGVVGGGAGGTPGSRVPGRQAEHAVPAAVRSVAGSPEFTGTGDEPPDDDVPADMPPDGPPAGEDASGPAELTGMDLIQRELGGQVISEIEG